MHKETAVDAKINYYVINLDRKPERWKESREAFAALGIEPIRFPAIDVSATGEYPDVVRVCPRLYYLFLGQELTPGRIGCRVSHMEIWRLFLESDADYAVICEDDALPGADFNDVLREALAYSQTWDMLCLFMENPRGEFPYVRLSGEYRLSTVVKGYVSSAAYMINRRAGKSLLNKLKYLVSGGDLTIRRGWYGVREASLMPFPVCLSSFAAESAITPEDAPPRFHPWHPVWWTKRFYRLYFRVFRYSFQGSRALRRWLFPPVPSRQ